MVLVRAGSTSGFDQLLNAFWEPLVRYAARQLGDLDVAKDIVQDGFIQVWDRRGTWSPVGCARAYLYKVVRSLVIDEQRRRLVRLRWAGRSRLEEHPTPPTPIQLLGEAELRLAYERALRKLPARRREAFVLVRLRGLSHEEAAEVMGISAQTVANQMSAALAELRSALEPLINSTGEPES